MRCLIYNNNVTYQDKWNTPENRAALAELEKKFFPRSICCPSCPVGWAPEVLAMFNQLDSEFGIRRNESTLNGDYIAPRDILRAMRYWLHHPISTVVRVAYIAEVCFLNPLLNKILRPKITLDQVKEKYGSLTIYTTTTNKYLDDYVDECRREVEIKLAVKGCYYPVESFWNSYTSTSHGTSSSPDIVKVEGDYVKRTTYRNIMLAMGLDIKTIRENNHVYNNRE